MTIMRMNYKNKSFISRNGTGCPPAHRSAVLRGPPLLPVTGFILILLQLTNANFHMSNSNPSPSSPSLAAAPPARNGNSAAAAASYEMCSEMLIWPLSSSATDDDGDESAIEVEDEEDDETVVIEIEPLHIAERAERERLRNEERARKRTEYENRKRLQITVNKMLGKIDDLSEGIGAGLCTTPSKHNHILANVPIGTHIYRSLQEKAELIAFFMTYSIPPGIKSKFPRTQFDDVVRLESNLQSLYDQSEIQNVHFLEYFTSPNSNHTLYEKVDGVFKGASITPEKLSQALWFFNPHAHARQNGGEGGSELYGHFMRPNETLHAHLIGVHREQPSTNLSTLYQRLGIFGYWSWPYFQCTETGSRANSKVSQPGQGRESDRILGRWMISYTVAFTLSANPKGEPFSFGLLSYDIDLTLHPINQCGFASEAERLSDLKTNPLFAFRETNKCNPESTQCHFRQLSPSNGWRKGNYECRCKVNHYALEADWNNTISGFKAEGTWCKEVSNSISPGAVGDAGENKTRHTQVTASHGSKFRDIVSCKPCPEECPNCTQGKSCMAERNVVFRLILLCVSVFCIVTTFFLIIVVYKLRKMPILKNSSPIFLCITLVGSIIMYSEMVALFPKLTLPSCIAVKWTRHLGFCITYTALYMKLCRVYLTYRVKSAHKIKLTEKHLLHWMSPIMVIMLLYLFAWTISDPPRLHMMMTWNGDRFAQCVYNWWDHSLAIGEFIFLTYGVYICWRLRENPDAQLISYSIYNIAVVNTVMVSIHLLIVPKAGPDWKYLFAFIRTQMSTTVTIALVLGSKLYHIIRGDAASKKEIANSANGFGHESLDLAEENQQLKEELQKMATQMERLKSYAMCKNNPHLKQYSTGAGGGGGSIAIPNEKDFGRFDSFTAL